MGIEFHGGSCRWKKIVEIVVTYSFKNPRYVFSYSHFSRRFSLANFFFSFFVFFFCFFFFFSFFLGSFGNQDRRRVRIRLSSEEKQKMAASCGQVQPPSSTLLISVRRKRRRPRPRIVLHLRWNVQEWHSRLFKQPCFFLSAFPWDSFGLHVSCLRVSLLSLISLVQVHQINPRLSILEN